MTVLRSLFVPRQRGQPQIQEMIPSELSLGSLLGVTPVSGPLRRPPKHRWPVLQRLCHWVSCTTSRSLHDKSPPPIHPPTPQLPSPIPSSHPTTVSGKACGSISRRLQSLTPFLCFLSLSEPPLCYPFTGSILMAPFGPEATCVSSLPYSNSYSFLENAVPSLALLDTYSPGLR